MTSKESLSKSEFKQLLAVSVNYSNSISKIFQNECGIEIFSKRGDRGDDCIAPFDASKTQNVCSLEIRKYNKENFLGMKRTSKSDEPYEFQRNSTGDKRVRIENFQKEPPLNNFISSRKNDFVIGSKNWDILLSERIENSFDLSKLDTTWSKKEEINFLCAFLIYKLFPQKVKISSILIFVPSRTKKQFFRHLYANKNSVEIFSQIFLDYSKSTMPELITDLDYDTGKVNQLFISLNKKILDKEFVVYFEENVQDESCQKYFKKIYKYITLEPLKYLKPPKDEENVYLSPKPKRVSFGGNSSQGIFINSLRNKSNEEITSSFLKIKDDGVLSNLAFKIEESLYANLLSLSKKDSLIIDDSLLYKLIMSDNIID